MLRSVLAVVAGYLAMMLAVTTFFSFVIFIALGVTPGERPPIDPPVWLTVVELATAPVLAGLGGYVCAWIARRREMQHAYALAGLVVVMNIVTIVAEGGMRPLWSVLGLGILGVIGVLLGARLRVRMQ
jgi:hypothetical protein